MDHIKLVVLILIPGNWVPSISVKRIEQRSSSFVRFLVLLVVFFTSFLKFFLFATACVRIGGGSLRGLIFLSCLGDGLTVAGIDIFPIGVIRRLICRARGCIRSFIWSRGRRRVLLLWGRGMVMILIVRGVVCNRSAKFPCLNLLF